jgi:hypothetical protein
LGFEVRVAAVKAAIIVDVNVDVRGRRSFQVAVTEAGAANVCIESHDYGRSPNGRFLRHRPERSERCLNYRKLYQGHGPLPKSQGVPKA